MRQERRRWWGRLVTVAAVLTVLAATISVLFRLAIDAVPGYRGEIEATVAKSVGHPARIGGIALTWHFLQPTLELRDVALLDAGSGAPLLEAARLNLGIGFWQALRGNLRLSSIAAAGIRLDADIDADGRIALRGFALDTTASSEHRSLLDDLERFDAIRVLDSELLLHDARLAAKDNVAAPLSFRLRKAAILHRGEHTTLDATLDPPAALAQRATLHAVLDGRLAQTGNLQGDWQLSVEHLAGWPWLADVLEPGVDLGLEQAALKIEGHIENGRPGRALIDLQIGTLRALRAGHPLAKIEALHLHARAEAQAEGAWRVDADPLTMRGPRGAWDSGIGTLSRAADGEGGGYRFAIARLRLDDLAPWLAQVRTLPPAAARLRDLQGDLESVDAAWMPARGDAPVRLTLHAKLDDVGLAGSPGQPGFSGLRGQLEGNLDSGRLVLDGSPLRLQLPEDFNEDVAIESLRGELVWQHLDDGWQLAAPALDLQMLGTRADGEGSLKLSADPAIVPLLKLQLHLRSTDAAALKPLMPKNWGPNTRDWLTRALTHARVAKGELKIDAPMTPRAEDGHMTMPWRLDLDIADGELDYVPGWPPVSALTAQLHFHDRGLDITAESGMLGGNHLDRLEASIADFQMADLVIDGRVSGDGAAFYRVLRASPMQTRLGNLLRLTEASGPTAVDVHLRVPLHGANPSVEASGDVRFDDAALAIRGVAQPLQSLRGQLHFGGAGVSAETLQATLYGTPIIARIHSEVGAAEGVLRGEFDFAPGAPGGLAEAFVPAWLQSGLSGLTMVQLRLPFSGSDSGEVTLSTDLQGVASTLPPPLAKHAGERLPLTIGIGGDAAVPLRLKIALADTLRAGLRFAEVDGVMKTRGVELLIGDDAVPRADADGFVVTGAPDTMDLASWGALLGAAQAGSGELPFTRADLHPAHLVYRSYRLGATHVLATPAANRSLHLNLDGAANGQIDWLPDDGGRVLARLQRVALEALPQLPSTPTEPSKDTPFDPATAPVIDLDCAALSVGDVDLGRLEILTGRVGDGQRIERLTLGGGKLVADVHGTWRRRGETASEPGSSAELSFDVGSTAIADVLKVFGYAPNLRASDARFSGRLRWPRVPEGLELSQAEGEVMLDVRRGSLKAVEPGAGRVLGLINLYALPRRLLFDFRDVVSEGLAFDTVKGNFKLASGNAETDDLQIVGPQAKVRLEGRIGLAARDYDQRVTVTPDISTGVTLGATLIGGPIGGSIALVAQSLFGKPFNRLARFSYRVTGSWDNPEVIKGTETAVPVAAPAAAPKNPTEDVNHG